MKKARFTETQILRVLKEVEGGRHVKDVCRENGVSEASYYNWKSEYGGMESSDIKRMKELGKIRMGRDARRDTRFYSAREVHAERIYRAI